eukprot:2677831-Pyramimonas_sp.AAC.1
MSEECGGRLRRHWWRLLRAWYGDAARPAVPGHDHRTRRGALGWRAPGGLARSRDHCWLPCRVSSIHLPGHNLGTFPGHGPIHGTSYARMGACGGEARASQIAARRHLQTGDVFNLFAGCDLGEPTVQEYPLQCLGSNCVLVMVMAPSRRSAGPLRGLNYRINNGTWPAHDEEDAPRIASCGYVAMTQMREG